MSQLDHKLKENRNRRRREALLASVGPQLKQLIANAEYSHESSSIKNAAFATWDSERNDWTTTRGAISSWHKCDYATWDSLLSSLNRISFPKSASGWLFFETDGPYYMVTFENFNNHLGAIAAYVASIGNYGFGWVGADRDLGVIVEFEQTTFCKNDFSLCAWQA